MIWFKNISSTFWEAGYLQKQTLEKATKICLCSFLLFLRVKQAIKTPPNLLEHSTDLVLVQLNLCKGLKRKDVYYLTWKSSKYRSLLCYQFVT